MCSHLDDPGDADWIKRTFHLDTWARRKALEVANRFEKKHLRPSVYHEERSKILNAIWPSATVFPLILFVERFPLKEDGSEFYFVKSNYKFMDGTMD